jgi:4'-phosphopantetheinyl transferase
MTSTAAAIVVQLWRVQLDADAKLDQLAATLSEDERARAARFVFERDRRRFVSARAALRSIIASRTDIPARKLQFEYASRKKPALAPWCRAADLRFNLSHAQGVALIGLTHGHELGVDVEQVRALDDTEALVAREFSQGERGVFAAVPVAERSEAFFRAWVRKEAYLKATGEGLHRPLADVEVTFTPHEAARLLAVSGDVSISQRWSMVSLAPSPGYVGALVAEAPAVRVVLHGFDDAGALARG